MSKKKNNKNASDDEANLDNELAELGFKERDIELLVRSNIDSNLLLHLKETELEKLGLSLGGIAVFRKHREANSSEDEEEEQLAPVQTLQKVSIPSFRGAKPNSIHSPTEFIQRFELAMEINLVSKENWNNMLMYQMNDYNDLQWLKHQAVANWDDLRSKFITHFERPNYAYLKADQLSKIKQNVNETIQQYGDRFQNLQREAGIDDSVHVVQFFRKGLRDKWMVTELKRRDSYENPIVSVQRVINEALFIETMYKNEETTEKVDKPKSTTKKKYWCNMHGYNNLHNEESCKRIPVGKTVKKGDHLNNSINNNNNNTSTIRCFKCQQVGHYANACTMRKGSHNQAKKLATEGFSDDEFKCSLQLNNTPVVGIIDTGANSTFVSRGFANRNSIAWNAKQGNLTLADGSKIQRAGVTEPLQIEIGETKLQRELHVIDMPDDLLIGRDLFALSGMTICNIPYKSSDSISIDQQKSCEKNVIKQDSNDEQELKTKLSDPIAKNQEVTGFCELEEAVVTLPIPSNKVAYRKQYPIAQIWHDRINNQISKWLSAGVIRKAEPGCKFNSPILAISKKTEGVIDHNKIRLCVDYRGLNDLIEDDRFPLPSFSEIFDSLTGKEFISVIDCDQSYHALPVAKYDQHKTAFSWNGENYVFCGAPFGIKTITSVFQRTMRRIMSDLKFVCNYVDDIIIFSDSLEDHVQHVSKVIELLTHNHFKINVEKSKFAQKELFILGSIAFRDKEWKSTTEN
jgi:hypothetical protein